jgi:hypothetical protein
MVATGTRKHFTDTRLSRSKALCARSRPRSTDQDQPALPLSAPQGDPFWRPSLAALGKRALDNTALMTPWV